MEQSILKSTKKVLNVAVEDDSYDLDIITYINSAFGHLHQLGIGPTAGFAIDGPDEEWTDFVGGPLPVISAVKTNISLRVKAMFDPPQLPHVANAMKEQLQESDWRLNVMREEIEWLDPTPGPMIIDGGTPADA